MPRPRGMALLAIFYASAAVLLLVLCALYSMRGQVPRGEIFGAPASGTTLLYFWGLSAIGCLYLSHAFWHGIRVGYYVYIALKVSSWLVGLVQGPGVWGLAAFVVEALVLAYVVQHQDWFRS